PLLPARRRAEWDGRSEAPRRPAPRDTHRPAPACAPNPYPSLIATNAVTGKRSRTGEVRPRLACLKRDQGREDEGERGGDDEPSPNSGGRGDDTAEQRPEPEAQRDGARPDAK